MDRFAPALPPALPILPLLPELTVTLADYQSAVLAAPPGAGKTTAVPLALLAAPWLAGRKILLLEPRRLAARAAAARMAELLTEPVGATVGFCIRFETKVSAGTRIEVLTEGVLTRRLQSDPELAGVGLVIFDEFHERSLEADLGLALCLDVQEVLRPDLRLLVMSATLDTAAVAGLLGGAPVLAAQGRAFPVTIQHLPEGVALALPERRQDLARQTAAGIRQLLAETTGDLLAFLPGGGEIRATMAELAARPQEGLLTAPLYGDLPRIDQERALMPDPGGRRRVVLASAIAETSLTIEGVEGVVDCGWTRAPRFDANRGLGRLVTVRVSQAEASQRAGRAGRLGPGRCLRLWPASLTPSLRPDRLPEMLASDLAGLALELAAWGVHDPSALRWLDPPPAAAWEQGRALLAELGALDAAGQLTARGRAMARLPAEPRLASLLLAAAQWGVPALGCDLAAILSERDLLLPTAQPRPCDLELRLQALAAFRQQGGAAARSRGADPEACRRVTQASRAWERLLPARQGESDRSDASDPSDKASRPGALLAAAFPDRVARLRPGRRHHFTLAAGRGAVLPPHDPLAGHEFLVVPALDAGRSEGRIFLAAEVHAGELRSVLEERIEVAEEVRWDDGLAAAVGRREERLGAVVLASLPLARPEPAALAACLLAQLTRLGPGALPFSPAARELQARVLSLRAWRPAEGWPDLSDQALGQELAGWLGPALAGLASLADLARLDLAALLAGRLTWEERQRLVTGAPTHLTVPSGSRRRLAYQPGGPPVLAVRLQELFGLAATPTVCWGQVPVMLHLLSPAGRPIQVTQDLAGFWARTYPEVRRELRGRYPRHPWPEDPWRAPPTSRAQPRPRR
ncbi:MAG: ATP-dependent helicase HrpB [Thermodesulfobacteriota bacterium]